ncbi:MAG: DUF2304 domain-containing protein [Tissierellia bacterium]|nr:DUF2304 domain-containing protein [Tissierellia bacterium]MDD4779586.1 DUF2304 domain-containing protein [Tissierellia bacterium]
MNLLTQIWIIILSVSIIVYLFEKIRKQKYSVKFSMPWFFAFLIVIILAIFPILIDKIALVLGIKEPTNAIFFIAICILVNNIINLSFSTSHAKKQSIRMAQEIALLKKTIYMLNDELNDKFKLSQELALLGTDITNKNNDK